MGLFDSERNVPQLSTTKYSLDDLQTICDQLERSRAALDAVRVIMESKSVDSIDVLYAKEFMRGLHKVTRFTGAAQEALTVALLPDVDATE